MTVFRQNDSETRFDATGIILAGGRNSRMYGTDKAKLIVDSQPILQHKYNCFRIWFDEVIVVCNRQRRNDYPHMNVVLDDQDGQGPLMGLYSGMKAAGNPVCFVTACDMPFMNKELVQRLLREASGFDIVAPMHNGYREPLLTVYHKRLLPGMERLLRNGRRKVSSCFHEARIRTVTEEEMKSEDPDGISFFNINTPQDLKQARKIGDSASNESLRKSGASA